jgi:hypothetical protein
LGNGVGKGTGKTKLSDKMFFNNFNLLFASRPFKDVADPVLGGIALAPGTSNIADQLFDWHPRE